MTTSVCGNGGFSLNHNNRKIKNEQHIDYSKTKDNVTYKQSTIEQEYENLFGESIKRYDEKQKRSDRKKGSSKNYLKEIRNDSMMSEMQEIVVTVGNIEQNFDDKKLCQEILNDYMLEWENRNPNLHLVNSVMHNDENGMPHLHIDFIPFGTTYKQGLDKQVSMSKAMQEQYNFKATPKINANVFFYEQEHKALESSMNKFGVEKIDGNAKGKEHINHNDFRKMKRELEEQKKIFFEEVKTEVELKNYPTHFGKVQIPKEDFEKIIQNDVANKMQNDVLKDMQADVSELKEHYSTERRKLEKNKREFEKYVKNAQKEIVKNVDLVNEAREIIKDNIHSLQEQKEEISKIQIDELLETDEKARTHFFDKVAEFMQRHFAQVPNMLKQVFPNAFKHELKLDEEQWLDLEEEFVVFNEERKAYTYSVDTIEEEVERATEMVEEVQKGNKKNGKTRKNGYER